MLQAVLLRPLQLLRPCVSSGACHEGTRHPAAAWRYDAMAPGTAAASRAAPAVLPAAARLKNCLPHLMLASAMRSPSLMDLSPATAHLPPPSAPSHHKKDPAPHLDLHSALNPYFHGQLHSGPPGAERRMKIAGLHDAAAPHAPLHQAAHAESHPNQWSALQVTTVTGTGKRHSHPSSKQ